jgi:hypothetical protein
LFDGGFVCSYAGVVITANIGTDGPASMAVVRVVASMVVVEGAAIVKKQD